MKIYQDINTGTEIISDSYPFVVLEQDESIIQVRSRMVVKGDVEVDVGCGNAFGGKNEEEQDQGNAGGAPVEKVNDLIDAFGYQETSYEKKDWQDQFKGFVKTILEKIKKNGSTEQQIKNFKETAGKYLKFISKKWDDLSVYTPKDGVFENSTIFSYWKNEEDEAPHFIFFLAGMKGVKV